MPCHSLFVYGTLRPRCRHPMAHFLAARGTHRGEAKVAGRLYDLGPYPASVPSTADSDWVFGDLFEIDAATLADLDTYEDDESPQPARFVRERGDIVLPGGDVASAWIYWFRGPLPTGATLIPSGQYEKIFAPPPL